MVDLKRRELAERYEWSVETAFRTMDKEHMGWIGSEEIGEYVGCGEREAMAIIRRIDTDGDGKVS